MRSDKELYVLFQGLPGFLCPLIGTETGANYEFVAVTLKDTERRCDGVLMPENGAGITLMVEFQMQKDEDIYPRVCIMRGLYKIERKPEYLCNVIIFKNESVDPKTADFRWMAEGCKTDFRVLYLDQVVKELQSVQPDHPILAVLGPFMEPSETVVQKKKKAWLRQITKQPLQASDLDILLKVFFSFLRERLPNMTEEEVKTMTDCETDFDYISLFNGSNMANFFEKRGLERGEKRGEQRGISKATRLLEDLSQQGVLDPSTLQLIQQRLAQS